MIYKHFSVLYKHINLLKYQTYQCQMLFEFSIVKPLIKYF